VTKLKIPMLGLGASGTLADSFTFQRRPGTSYVRKKPVPADPKSPAQLAQRQKYRDAVDAWLALTAEEKEAWRGVCPGLTAYQCFLRSQLKYVPPPPPEEYTEEQTQHDSAGGLIAFWSYGQSLIIPNRKVSKLAFVLYRVGSPPGTISLNIRRISDYALIAGKTWGNVADLPSSATLEEVTFDTPTLINEAVYICAEVSALGAAGNYGAVRYRKADVKAGEYLWWEAANHSHDGNTGYDCAYRYKYYEV